MKHASSGFTLIELLVSSLLVGAVLAMAMQGFTSVRRASELNRCKTLAHDEAVQGVAQVVRLLKKASIIYYSGHPLTALSGAAADTANLAALAPPPAPGLVPVPPNAGTLAPTQITTLLPGPNPLHYSLATPSNKYSAMPVGSSREKFRFRTAMAAGLKTLSTDPGATGRFFPSPMVYFAEAIYPVAPTAVGAAGTNVGANIPLGWNFYIMYLVPMDLSGGAVGRDDEPLCPAFGGSLAAKRDMGGAAAWTRSTLPYELRLFTVTKVSSATTGFGALPTYGRQSDAIGIWPVPFDLPNNTVVYDPVTVATTLSGTAIFNSKWTTGALATGERVLGGGAHGNYGFLGNDPPSAAVWATVGAAQCSDIVLAKYIDPDAIDGTFIRFVNTDPNTNSRRLVNTLREPGVADMDCPLAWNPKAQMPSRIVVSITTRYRTTREIPFQFGTDSQEVSLEVASKFHVTSGTRTVRF